MHLIILPGWNHTKEMWSSVSASLSAAAVPHTTLDLPGFGTEPVNLQLQSIDDVAAWLHNKLEALHITEEVILCGHSYGGRVAAAYTAENISKVHRLILIGSPNIYRPTISVRVKKLFAELLRPLTGLVPETIKRRVRSDDYAQARQSELHTLFRAVITDDQTDLLLQITTPTHLIWGEHDDAAPLRLAKEMQQLLPNNTLEIVAGCGHDVHLEKPTWLAAKIKHYATLP